MHGKITHLNVHVLKAGGLVFRVDRGVDSAIGKVHLDDIVEHFIFAQQRDSRAAESHGILNVAELRITRGILAEICGVKLYSAAWSNHGLGRRLRLGRIGGFGVFCQRFLQVCNAFRQIRVRRVFGRRQSAIVRRAILIGRSVERMQAVADCRQVAWPVLGR